MTHGAHTPLTRARPVHPQTSPIKPPTQNRRRPNHASHHSPAGKRSHLAAYGIPEQDIGRVVGTDPKTLRKHYRDELDLGATKATAQVAGFLFAAATSGNVTAQIFWLKTRARWKEPPADLRHSGTLVTHEASGKSALEVLQEKLARMAERTSEDDRNP